MNTLVVFVCFCLLRESTTRLTLSASLPWTITTLTETKFFWWCRELLAVYRPPLAGRCARALPRFLSLTLTAAKFFSSFYQRICSPLGYRRTGRTKGALQTRQC